MQRKASAIRLQQKRIKFFVIFVLSVFILFLPRHLLAQNTSFQPHPPYYATFYYMWYKAPNPDGKWDYWTDGGANPPNTWFSHYLPDVNPSAWDPANELYSENNYNIFKWQMGKMAEAKIEVAIASWWGQGTREDITFNNVINSFMGKSDNPYPNLRWAVYYEDEGFSDPAVSVLVSDLTYIKNKYAGSPYMLKINGKPVMFVYAGVNDAGGMAQRWKDANAAVGNYFYTVLKVYPGSNTDPNQPSAWHQYAPAARSGTDGKDYYFISPGFWLDGNPERLPRSLTEFDTAAKNMVSASVAWKLIETWNEWGEGTSVEPGVQAITVNGKDEPDTNGYLFQNRYIDILKSDLPALEQGTGIGATPSPTLNPTPTMSPQGKTGDVNGDGKVDIIDIGVIIDNYGKSPIPNPKADINHDGVVNIIDIGICIDNYGK